MKTLPLSFFIASFIILFATIFMSSNCRKQLNEEIKNSASAGVFSWVNQCLLYHSPLLNQGDNRAQVTSKEYACLKKNTSLPKAKMLHMYADFKRDLILNPRRKVLLSYSGCHEYDSLPNAKEAITSFSNRGE